MTGGGEMETLGSDSYRGKMHMGMNSEGQRVEMARTFNGKRLGRCDYRPASNGAGNRIDYTLI